MADGKTPYGSCCIKDPKPSSTDRLNSLTPPPSAAFAFFHSLVGRTDSGSVGTSEIRCTDGKWILFSKSLSSSSSPFSAMIWGREITSGAGCRQKWRRRRNKTIKRPNAPMHIIAPMIEVAITASYSVALGGVLEYCEKAAELLPEPVAAGMTEVLRSTSSDCATNGEVVTAGEFVEVGVPSMGEKNVEGEAAIGEK